MAWTNQAPEFCKIACDYSAFLYNYSQPWVTHFSLQHTHNHPRDLWETYGLKPFMYDEVKYEGRLGSNWGSLSAPQMVRFFNLNQSPFFRSILGLL